MFSQTGLFPLGWPFGYFLVCAIGPVTFLFGMLVALFLAIFGHQFPFKTSMAFCHVWVWSLAQFERIINISGHREWLNKNRTSKNCPKSKWKRIGMKEFCSQKKELLTHSLTYSLIHFSQKIVETETKMMMMMKKQSIDISRARKRTPHTAATRIVKTLTWAFSFSVSTELVFPKIKPDILLCF